MEERSHFGTGIIGAGFIGRVHARAARLAGARLVGVAASSPESAAQAAEEMLAETAFDSAEELIASDQVDVVHICAPNSLHYPLAIRALESGKHIVLEKPVALTSSEATEIAELVRATGLIATVPFAYRYYPTVREARSRVAGWGGLFQASGGYLQDWLLSPEADNWRVDPELGGTSRAFADIGAHWCDLFEFVSGERIASLTATTSIVHAERNRSDAHSFQRGNGTGELRRVETEDSVSLLFQTEGGATGNVLISQVSPGRKNHLWFEVSGPEQAVAFDQENPEILWTGDGGGVRVIPRDAELLAPEAARYVTVPAGHPQGFQDCFDAFVSESYQAMAGSIPADGLPRIEDGLRAVRITESVIESAATRTWIDVPQVEAVAK